MMMLSYSIETIFWLLNYALAMESKRENDEVEGNAEGLEREEQIDGEIAVQIGDFALLHQKDRRHR